MNFRYYLQLYLLLLHEEHAHKTVRSYPHVNPAMKNLLKAC